jgi:hypothetical protein
MGEKVEKKSKKTVQIWTRESVRVNEDKKAGRLSADCPQSELSKEQRFGLYTFGEKNP